LTKLLNILHVVLFIFFLNGCSETQTDSNASLQSISYSPNQTYLIKDRNISIQTTANYSDGSSKPMNEFLNWTSSNVKVAKVDNGQISALQEGNVTITYSTLETLSSGKPVIKNDIYFEIIDSNLISISISPSPTELYVGQELALNAIGTFDATKENTTSVLSDINFSSDDLTTLTVTSAGVIKAIAEGSANITAKDISSGILKTIPIHVVKSPYKSITITAPKTTFNTQETIELEAIGTNESDVEIVITDSVVWKSTDEDIVSIESNGSATAVAIGESYVTASLDDIDSDQILLRVAKDKYLRLTDITSENSSEVLDFPHMCYYHMDCKKEVLTQSDDANVVLKRFKLEAIGKDFTIKNLEITDFNQTISWLDANSASFNGLYENQIIQEDQSVEFTLESFNLNNKDLVYSFSVDNETLSSFIGSYKLVYE
jgi:uncharacterized protein YjdB